MVTADDSIDDLITLLPAPPLAHIQGSKVHLKTREVYVDGDIEEDFGAWFTSVIRFLESVSHKPILVWINTPGGDISSMFTFHDLVRASPCKVITVGMGMVCSAGVLMLACGHYRMVSESCVLMSHRGDDEAVGTLEQMEAQMEVAKWREKHWAVLMDRYTPTVGFDGRPRDEKYWFALGKKQAEWWLRGGAEIIEAGIADKIYKYEDLPDGPFKS